MKLIQNVIFKISLAVCLVFLPGAGLAERGEGRQAAAPEKLEIKMSSTLNPGLNHILDMVRPGSTTALHIPTVAPVLDFVSSPKSQDDIYVSDDSFKASSAYIEFDLNHSMVDILKLSYNPDIPSYLTTPSSIRLGYWKEIREGENSFEHLWELLPDLEAPVVVRGVETVENTPDIHTGAYYKYDLERTMILFKYQGRNVFMSLSQQKGISMVGKKGVVLGDDEDWNYLYSGEKGINKMGLGWVDSYMYDSSSIIVYYETEPGGPQVRCAAFKWLRAGWKNINMVKNHHIYKGMQRFAQDYKTIVEHPAFPGVDTLADTWTRIETLDPEELKNINRRYYRALEKRYAKDESVSSKWTSNLLKDDLRIDESDVHELRSVLVIEYLKSVLGKKYEIDVESL